MAENAKTEQKHGYFPLRNSIFGRVLRGQGTESSEELEGGRAQMYMVFL